jgi:hypothetical protein
LVADKERFGERCSVSILKSADRSIIQGESLMQTSTGMLGFSEDQTGFVNMRDASSSECHDESCCKGDQFLRSPVAVSGWRL